MRNNNKNGTKQNNVEISYKFNDSTANVKHIFLAERRVNLDQ